MDGISLEKNWEQRLPVAIIVILFGDNRSTNWASVFTVQPGANAFRAEDVRTFQLIYFW